MGLIYDFAAKTDDCIHSPSWFNCVEVCNCLRGITIFSTVTRIQGIPISDGKKKTAESQNWGTFLLGGSSHFVSGLVHPSYKWTNPFITRVITHLLSGVSHQVDFLGISKGPQFPGQPEFNHPRAKPCGPVGFGLENRPYRHQWDDSRGIHLGVSSSSWGYPKIKRWALQWKIPSFDSWMMTGGTPSWRNGNHQSEFSGFTNMQRTNSLSSRTRSAKRIEKSSVGMHNLQKCLKPAATMHKPQSESLGILGSSVTQQFTLW